MPGYIPLNLECTLPLSGDPRSPPVHNTRHDLPRSPSTEAYDTTCVHAWLGKKRTQIRFGSRPASQRCAHAQIRHPSRYVSVCIPRHLAFTLDRPKYTLEMRHEHAVGNGVFSRSGMDSGATAHWCISICGDWSSVTFPDGEVRRWVWMVSVDYVIIPHTCRWMCHRAGYREGHGGYCSYKLHSGWHCCLWLTSRRDEEIEARAGTTRPGKANQHPSPLVPHACVCPRELPHMWYAAMHPGEATVTQDAHDPARPRIFNWKRRLQWRTRRHETDRPVVCLSSFDSWRKKTKRNSPPGS